MGRQVALVFFGEQRDKSYHAHESGSFMTIPLMVLMVGALVGGVMNLPGTHWLGHWLEPVLAEETVKLNIVLAVVTGILAVLAALSGWWYYVANAAKVKLGGQDPLYHYLGAFWEGFQEAWYFDDFYNNTVVRGYRGLSSFLARIFDPEGIDGIVNGVGWVLSRAATGVRSLQTGYVRTYAFIFLVGVILIIGYLVVAL
jgi:NADH-quinone oxidoreductase subunit L